MGRFSMKRNDPGPYSTQKKDKKGRGMIHGSVLYVEEWPMGYLSRRVISLHYGGDLFIVVK